MHRRMDQTKMLTSGAINVECLKEAAYKLLASVLRIQRTNVVVKLKLPMHTCRLSSFSGANFQGYIASISVFILKKVKLTANGR